jgi:hypothetical protein
MEGLLRLPGNWIPASMHRRISKVTAASFVLLASVAMMWALIRFWPKRLPVHADAGLPLVLLHEGEIEVALPTEVLVAQVGAYPSTAASMLRFDWIRSQESVNADRLMYCIGPAKRGGTSRIYLQLRNNMLADIPYLGTLMGEGIIPGFELQSWTGRDLLQCQQESSEMNEKFASSPKMLLTDIPDRELIRPMADFLAFKSATDRRIRNQQLASPFVLGAGQARELAEDIIVVARFYSLPLSYFLAIGAMENNYMSVRGDLGHSVWKKRPQHGDTVLRRKQGKVLVRNYSLGVWQITRETLRYAQLLYVEDQKTRNYTLLPERLQPIPFRDPDEIQPQMLTTFAGLLFRKLLDEFHGDVLEAVGAYNGGLGKPNRSYAESVSVAASYARKVIVFSAVADSDQSRS